MSVRILEKLEALGFTGDFTPVRRGLDVCVQTIGSMNCTELQRKASVTA